MKYGYISIIVLFLLCATPVLAFLSPSTITLVANSVGAIIWGGLVLIAVNLFVWWKKAKGLKIILIISTIALIMMITVAYQRYTVLEDLNVYDKVKLAEYEVDLNMLEDLSEYKIFQIKGKVHKTVWVDKAEMINWLGPKNVIKYYNSSADEFAAEHNLTKDDKILFLCESGLSSQESMRFMRDGGYNAQFARLSRMTDDSLISANFKVNENVSSKLVIFPYEGQDNLLYIGFDLYFDANYLGELRKEVSVTPHQDVTRSMIEEHNLLCTVNFQCVLTKYLLDSLDITEAKIYKLPVSEKEYDRQLDRLR